MKLSFNKVLLTGIVFRDPETKEVTGGHTLGKLTIVSEDEFEFKGEKKQTKMFHNIVGWNKKAEMIAELKKDQAVYIEGKLVNRSYETNGETKYVTEVSLEKIEVLSGQKITESAKPNIQKPEKKFKDINADDVKDCDLGEFENESIKPTNEDDEDVNNNDLPF